MYVEIFINFRFFDNKHTYVRIYVVLAKFCGRTFQVVCKE